MVHDCSQKAGVISVTQSVPSASAQRHSLLDGQDTISNPLHKVRVLLLTCKPIATFTPSMMGMGMPATLVRATSSRAQPPTSLFGFNKTRLASLGAAGSLTYNGVKWIKHSLLVSSAWYLVARSTGVSPFKQVPELMKMYAKVYASIVLFNPAKYALIVAASPAVERLVAHLARALSVQKAMAYTIMFAVVNLSGAAFYAAALLLASMFSGVPIQFR